MKVRVTNIQRFSLHDGPGIRTTVFFKGCNLRCPWCANPENIERDFTPYYNEQTKEKGIFGKDITLDEIYDEVTKDAHFYTLHQGGVTFSGGEPLLQIKVLEPLLKKLKAENFHLAIETALQVPTELVNIALSYIDFFIIDMKVVDKEINERVFHGNTDLYEANLKRVTEAKGIDILRIPLNNEYTLKEKNVQKMLTLIEQYKPKKVEIFKVHDLAESKYKSIGKETPSFSKVEDEKVEELCKQIKKMKIEVETLNI